MEISKLFIKAPRLTPFQTYLLDNSKVKNLCKEFDFYHISFVREMYTSDCTITLTYPKANVYWFIDFKKYINENILNVDCAYKEDWINLLIDLKAQIKSEYETLKWQLDHLTTAKDIVEKQLKYSLRPYQAFDLSQLLIKFRYWNKRALCLSEQRTGKSRVALSLFAEEYSASDLNLIICPKAAALGWEAEVREVQDNRLPWTVTIVKSIASLKKLELDLDHYNVRIITYDLFKKLTVPQLRQLTSRCKHILFTVDEVHRLRNFKTDQSEAIFNFMAFCEKDEVDLGMLGMTGTPSVKEDSDVFGTLCFVNNSKINFNPYLYSFDLFKEYFYYCEDTSFGKKTKAIRREDELNFIIQLQSVQTKQKDLEFFKYYEKEYKKIELVMDEKQREIYDSVYEHMDYDEDIDCQNKLVQLIRLQQICIDPSDLVPTYELISPKLKYIVDLTKRVKFKYIVACKKTKPLKHLMNLLDAEGLKYASYIGEYNLTKRKDQLNLFNTDIDCKIMLLQLDAGKEALTLPIARAIVFLDRDFAQGYNEQAEARMTPIDGSACKKFVIDLVMKDSKEEEIYNTLVIKKKSINAMNLVFKTRKES